MEFRVLQYFLAVTREQSISGAAESLHLSQPTLSRQLRDMEEELGKQLIIRGNRKITLTEEGMLLRKRAEEIVDLVQRTENEIMLSDETITGDIFIGTGETDGVRLITRTAKDLQKDYSGIHYHIASGDAIDVIERIDKGLLDFGILLEPIDLSKYNYLRLPAEDVWGVLMRRDSILAAKENITAKDLWAQPLILSRQSMNGDKLSHWLKKEFSELNIVATYNLVYNASLMVDEGLGYALCLDKLINTTGESNLIFKPLYPELHIGMYIMWKKYQVFSKAAEKFLDKLQDEFSNDYSEPNLSNDE
jgi:DNA-binding transcriptional LysR family regulator